jgi:hypothetical protein
MFTQTELGALLAAERKRVRDQVLREVTSAQAEAAPPAAPSTPSTPTAPAQPSTTADTRVLDFRDAIADFGLPRDRRRAIERFYLQSGSADPDGWLGDNAEVFGLVRQQPAQAGSVHAPSPGTMPPTTPAPPAPAAPAAPPASDRGGPASQPDAMRFDNPLRWQQSDVERMLAEKESYAAGVRYVRDRFKQGLKGTTIEFSRRGQ